MRFRGLAVLLLGLVMLALPTTASAKVALVKLTSPARPGSYATLTVSVTPNSRCTITVTYKSGPSEAAGLVPKRSVAGKVSWTWRVGTRTTPGRWPISVNCGTAGSLKTSFVVRR